MKKLKRKLGFTIAELVIATMLVAGIAMIMLPILQSNNERQIFTASLRKTITELQQINQAIGLLQARGEIGIEVDIIEVIPKVMKLQKQKGTNSYKYTFVSGYTHPNDMPPRQFVDNGNLSSSAGGTNDITWYVLKNGVYFFIYGDPGEQTILVDINGKKQPNRVGKDLYYFEFKFDDKVDRYTVEPYNAVDSCQPGCPSSSKCSACAYWFFQNEKITWF